jgi:transcription initiation factor IIE alpha subunit
MSAFFDKVVGGLNKGVNAVSEGSKYILEKNQINTYIQNTEKEKISLLTQIGSIVYAKHVTENFEIEECNELFYMIEGLNQRIEELNEKLKETEEQMRKNIHSADVYTNGIRCSCGNVNAVGAKFCTKCGKMLEYVEDNKDETVN